MGTVVPRKTKKGVSYLAEVKKTRKGEVVFYETATFSREILAKQWVEKIEQRIKDNPDMLSARNAGMTLQEAITLWRDEVGHNFGKTTNDALKAIQERPIAKKRVSTMRRTDWSAYALERAKTCAASTVNKDFQHLRGVLKHVIALHGVQVDMNEFILATDGLRSSRVISRSKKRDRLMTNDEAVQLTQYFYKKYHRRKSAYPMHLIMWLAIYTCRRQEELTLMRFEDDSGDFWLIRDTKDPTGAKGNHKHGRISEEARAIINELITPAIRNNMKSPNKNWDESLLLPLSIKNISASWTRACKMLEIRDLRFHDLRHEGSTRLAERGMTIPQIQEYSGHESWSSLQRYVNTKKMMRTNVIEYADIELG